jgi:hypothetical protein
VSLRVQTGLESTHLQDDLKASVAKSVEDDAGGVGIDALRGGLPKHRQHISPKTQRNLRLW